MNTVYKRPSTIFEGAITTYCAGCMHATVNKLLAEVVEEMGITEKIVVVNGVGCGGPWGYVDVDTIPTPHGRACAAASAFKRCCPDSIVVTYQGDGDYSSIGLAESMHAANRGENITTLFINNLLYGMTGGQFAPTTLVGMKTTTTPEGRKVEEYGYPLHMSEIISNLPATAYVARCTCSSVPNVRKTKESIKKAIQAQIDGKGYSMVEVLSACPTNWKMSPTKALEHINNVMVKEFPLGEFKAK